MLLYVLGYNCVVLRKIRCLVTGLEEQPAGLAQATQLHTSASVLQTLHIKPYACNPALGLTWIGLLSGNCRNSARQSRIVSAGDFGSLAQDAVCLRFCVISLRHIFEGRKYVEEYHTSDIERELGMDRLGLICLALLLGSDYTEGVAGIGIVNAVEVRACFLLSSYTC